MEFDNHSTAVQALEAMNGRKVYAKVSCCVSGEGAVKGPCLILVGARACELKHCRIFWATFGTRVQVQSVPFDRLACFAILEIWAVEPLSKWCVGALI